MERHVHPDLPVEPDEPPRRARRRFQPAPYLLGAPAILWLAILFIVPLFTMLSLSLQTCDPNTYACTMTWNFGEFGNVISRYSDQLIRSIVYAGAATVIDLVIAFPLAYWIAFYGGRRKNFYLLMLLVPFFVSFVIRTTAWQFLLADQGPILGPLKSLHLLPQNYHVLATWIAVVAGMAYNYLPFTALPLYVALERIDRRVIEAAGDLYSNRTSVFMRVIFPLAIPGIFAAFLLTFVPAAGDFVNASILGGTNNTMIGNVIQQAFLVQNDYPAASALSAILMAAMLIGIFAYSKILGARTIEEYV
ncbi:MAG TPA: ABC transporter permease [Actinomycetota bacterium]|nr:ABC transporter permease [Actinomycetota bacterium]